LRFHFDTVDMRLALSLERRPKGQSYWRICSGLLGKQFPLPTT